jgi:hypothetical protein
MLYLAIAILVFAAIWFGGIYVAGRRHGLWR